MNKVIIALVLMFAVGVATGHVEVFMIDSADCGLITCKVER